MYVRHCFTVDHRAASAVVLTLREAHAVAVGRADAFRYGWEASPPAQKWRRAFDRAVRRVTGIAPLMPFADERLEALRLFACMIRRDDRRVHAQASTLVAAGFSATALRQAIGLALA